MFCDSRLEASSQNEETTALRSKGTTAKQMAILTEVYEAISTGAEAFLRAEYRICSMFVLAFAVLIWVLISWGQDHYAATLTAISFLLGATTSVACGYIGMRVAVFSNVRTTINAQKDGFKDCFNTAFRAGAVMGFALTGLGIAVLYGTLLIFRAQFAIENWDTMMGCISGYGLGGSTIAMFGRVGGGIYTKVRSSSW